MNISPQEFNKISTLDIYILIPLDIFKPLNTNVLTEACAKCYILHSGQRTEWWIISYS